MVVIQGFYNPDVKGPRVHHMKKFKQLNLFVHHMIPSQQLTLLQWEDPKYDADKEHKRVIDERTAEKESKEQLRKHNETDWDEVHKFTKNNKYFGTLCIKVSSWKVDGRPCLEEHTEMKYVYEGYNGRPMEGSMSGGGGFCDLRNLDTGIICFARKCDDYDLPRKIFFSKAAEDLIDTWIKEGNNFYVKKEDISTLGSVAQKIRIESTPRADLWDMLEWHAIKELGYEKGIEFLVNEYKEWRHMAMQHYKQEIIEWQNLWTTHGPYGWYIERVEKAVQEYNIHASRLSEPPMETPDFLERWKHEWKALIEKKESDYKEKEKEQLSLKKKQRNEKLAARKKETDKKNADRKEFMINKYGTPFTNKMKACSTANEARDIISAYTTAFHDIEVNSMLSPTIGRDGSGCAYRGFSTLTKTEVKKAVKRVSEKNPELGENLEALIIDIRESEPFWEKLYADEIGRMMGNIHGCSNGKKEEAK